MYQKLHKETGIIYSYRKSFSFAIHIFGEVKKKTFITMHNKVENLDSCENLNVSDPFCNKMLCTCFKTVELLSFSLMIG